jgi:hypothetical protein
MPRARLLFIALMAAAVAAFASACSIEASLGVGDDDLKTAPTCAGATAKACPGGFTCVDDPRDGCDPARGGRACDGICVRAERSDRCGGIGGAICSLGAMCVDDPRDDCDPAGGGRDCIGLCVRVSCSAPAAPNCPAGQRFDRLRCGCVPVCGGPSDLKCPEGKACVDDPLDACDPADGGAQCLGICR